MGPTEILLGVAFPIIVGVGVALALSDASDAEFWVARACFIVAGLEALAFAFIWLRTVDWSLSIRMSLGAATGAIIASAILGAISWVDFREGRQNLSLQKYALFWVGIDKDVYQLGIVAKFVNVGDKLHLVKDIQFERFNWSLYPRGSYSIERIKGDDYGLELAGDNYIKPHDQAFLKLFTHIKVFMKADGGDTPELIIRGSWDATIGDQTIKLIPRLYSVYPKFISSAEWDAIGTSKSSINVNDLHFKLIPPRPTADGPYMNYLVYNSDRTATIDNVYFSQTPPVKGAAGVMVFISGKGPPPLGIGWVILGNTFYEVWSDPEKLALYNSLYLPDKDGLPKPFGFFAGSENAMAGPVGRQLHAPVTVGAEILEIDQPRIEPAH